MVTSPAGDDSAFQEQSQVMRFLLNAAYVVRAGFMAALFAVWGFPGLPATACRAEQPPDATAIPHSVAQQASGVEPATFISPSDRNSSADARSLAASVTIYRDAFGTPHIDGPTDAAVLFGLAYAQAEDNFWQVEDNYILAMGRYSEVHGPEGLNSDLLNRAFEIVPTSRQDYPNCDPGDRRLTEAFVAGLNYYLAKNPQVQPRLIEHFEPWQVLAYFRQVTLELCFRYTRLHNNYLPRSNERIWSASGSNAWAIAPQRTRDGKALLLVNPHLPNYGFAQMYEAHMHSAEGLDVAGAMFFGNPMPSVGHNANLGWALTTNEPDIADVWRITFDDSAQPLRYRYGDSFRTATQWTESIKVLGSHGAVARDYVFRKTHDGPLVQKEDDQHYLAARVSNLYELRPMQQALRMSKAQNLAEFRSALALMQLPFMNVLYADREGNIFYLYDGVIPRRDPQFNWSKPVDGADPRTQWQGFFTIDELPQLLNPRAGYVQNCNSSPFTTTHLDNPDRKRFPAYLAEDRDDDKLRAKRSREILQSRDDWTFEDLQKAAFDTTLYWAQHEMPQVAGGLEQLRQRDPQAAQQAEPLLAHLKAWDGRITPESTAATLATGWYEELYGEAYPGEKLKPQFVNDPAAQVAALITAAGKLQATFGDWKVAWGDVYRVRRQPHMADVVEVSPDDVIASLPCVGGHGPMGVVFTEYYTPVLNLPLMVTPKKHYGVLGASYLAVYEFGDKMRGASLVNFGESGDPKSPHYFDQAPMMASGKMKPELFHWNDVLASAAVAYHPGQKPLAVPLRSANASGEN